MKRLRELCDADVIFPAVVALVFLLNLAVAIWWAMLQWDECRDAGLSVLYCIQHVL